MSQQYELRLYDFGRHKINAIRLVRQYCTGDLYAAKLLVDEAMYLEPVVVKTGSRYKLAKLKKLIEDGTVSSTCTVESDCVLKVCRRLANLQED